jgi:magnesium transporter
MIGVFDSTPQGLVRRQVTVGSALTAPLWIDLLEPTAAEESLVESALAIDVPTREEMREIEASARFYEEKDSLFMTATVVTKLDTDSPQSSQVTFILSKDRLITNRYVDPLPFRSFIAHAQTHVAACTSPAAVLTGLIEALINRLADTLEKIGANLDAVSADVFTPPRRKKAAARDFNEILDRIGGSGDTTSKARESLVSLGRLLAFAQQSATVPMPQEQRSRCRTLSKDVLALSDHASFLANKVTFLLDATLGLISIAQNNIIKIFSVVTVFMLPPSLIAGIFGMNFHQMPLLQTAWGFWVTGGLMLLSALLPYAYFRWRGWL